MDSSLENVEVALAVTQLDVGDAVPFLGHWQQRLRQHGDFFGVDRQLTALGAAHLASHADDVADIDHRQQVARRFRRRILVREDLHLARGVMNIHEHAGIARGINAPRHRHRITGLDVGFDIGIFFRQLGIAHRAVEMRRINVADLLAQQRKFLAAHFCRVGGEGGGFGLGVGHRVRL